MKRKINIIFSTSAASLLALAALAQNPPNAMPDHAYPAHDRMDRSQSERLNGAVKASEVIGMTVQNNSGEKLGKVQDLAVDVESGRVVEVILSIGGFLGMGDTLTAVPPGILYRDADQKMFQLDADKAKLEGAPKFEDAKWADCTGTSVVTQVYAYYHEEPYFMNHQGGFMTTKEAETIVNSLPRRMDGTINTDGSSTVELTRNQEAVRTLGLDQNMPPTRNADGTWNRESSLHQNMTNTAWANGSVIQKASKVMGMTVKNQQDEKLGEVDNLMVDLPAGRIVAVIISSGGFLGMGDELSAVPPSAFRCNPSQDYLQLNTTKEILKDMPHFKSNQWPDFSQPGYVGRMYRAYHVEPYFDNDSMMNANDSDNRSPDATKADNAARNMSDRNGQTLTSFDQGTSKADIATTAQIRKQIISAKNMSVNAQNVKIITRDGHVTLRGPVNNASEKQRIGEIADRIVPNGQVDNQLEVQITTSSN